MKGTSHIGNALESTSAAICPLKHFDLLPQHIQHSICLDIQGNEPSTSPNPQTGLNRRPDSRWITRTYLLFALCPPHVLFQINSIVEAIYGKAWCIHTTQQLCTSPHPQISSIGFLAFLVLATLWSPQYSQYRLDAYKRQSRGNTSLSQYCKQSKEHWELLSIGRISPYSEPLFDPGLSKQTRLHPSLAAVHPYWCCLW